MEIKLISSSPQQTIEIGSRIGVQLKGGEVIGLVGSLGSGKTHLIKGIAAGLDAKGGCREVNSPTFVIINEYIGRLNIFHIDAYRLSSIDEFEMLGFDDLCGPESVVLIEWADKVEPALKGINWIRIELSHIGPNDRALHIINAPAYLNG